MKKLQINTEFNGQIKLAAYILYPLFHHYGWKWGDEVPTLDQIEDHIVEQVDELCEHPEYEMISSGRITTRIENDGMMQWVNVSLDLVDLYDERS